jgi:hypothetical protein
MNEFDIVVYVTVDAVFPGTVAHEESMRAALARAGAGATHGHLA